MSSSRLAIAAFLTLLVSSTGISQDCGFGCGGKVLPFGNNCGSDRCLTAPELWAGYENTINCKGCVKQNKLNLGLPGFGGRPACRIDSCGNETCQKFQMPSGFAGSSVFWPRPMGLQSCGKERGCGVDFHGIAPPRNRACDVKGEVYGKTGESQNAPQSIMPQTKPAQETKPVSPIVAPVPMTEIYGARNSLPLIESEPIR